MKLREIVEGKEYPHIEVRLYGLEGIDELFGECAYINGKLISLDGDSYDLDEEVNEYGMFGDTLVIVEHTEWLHSDGTITNTKNIDCVNAIERMKEFRKDLY